MKSYGRTLWTIIYGIAKFANTSGEQRMRSRSWNIALPRWRQSSAEVSSVSWLIGIKIMDTAAGRVLCCLFCVLGLFSNGWSMFCPVISPTDDWIHFTDKANQSFDNLTLVQCAIRCHMSSILGGACWCFNHDSTSKNCDLFNYKPTHYTVDPSVSLLGFQVKTHIFTSRISVYAWSHSSDKTEFYVTRQSSM